MNEKRLQIIEAASRLFARQGYHSTSMQEIADASGVAKGSVYHHFDSKEDLLLSIFKYYYGLMVARISRVSDEDGLSARERLVKQIHMQFQELLHYEDFIEMQMREQAVQINDEITHYLFQIRAETLEGFRLKIVEVYDEKVHPYAVDLAAMLSAVISEYIGYIIFEKRELDLAKLARFIVDRLDDLANGLASKQPEPMITEGITFPKTKPHKETQLQIHKIRELAENLVDQDDILESLDLIEKEMEAEEPNKVMIQGMLAFLDALEEPAIQEHVKKIGRLLPF